MSGTRVFAGGDAVLPGGHRQRDTWVAVTDGRIADLGTGRPPAGERVDTTDLVVVPGYVDTHVHGGGGGDVMSPDRDERLTVRRMHARHGTTSMVASTVTASIDDLVAAAQRLAADRDVRPPGHARLLGVHFEGPFLAPSRKGAHAESLLRDPDLDAWRRLSDGVVVSLTIAPELPGAIEVIRAAVADGVVVSVGHTDADYAEVVAAVETGAVAMTHTYNAMRPLGHRRPGGVGAAMTLEALTCELILDLVHVDVPAAQALVRAAGPQRVCLVTDAMSAAGMPDGRTTLGGLEVEVAGDRVVLAGTDTLAGSVLTMDVAVRNAVEALGLPVETAVTMATEVPAGLFGRHDIGRLARGAQADLCLVDDRGVLHDVWIAGERVDTHEEGSR